MSVPTRSLESARLARLSAALCVFVIWSLLSASMLWWWLRADCGAAVPEAPVAARPPADVNSTSVARALGANGVAAPASTPAAAARTDGVFALRGVLTHGEGGAALIAVGGKVRTVRVGAPVGKDAEGWTLHEAQPHAVVLAGGGRQVRLEMPDLTARTRAFMGTGAQAAPAVSAPAAAPQPTQRTRPQGNIAGKETASLQNSFLRGATT